LWLSPLDAKTGISDVSDSSIAAGVLLEITMIFLGQIFVCDLALSVSDSSNGN
jgi:hypothetical protein